MNAEGAPTYPLQCHCGNLRAAFRMARAPADWSVSRCRCSFCRAHGALWTSDPHGLLVLPAPPVPDVVAYRFGQRSADFLICGRCGSLVAASMEAGGARFGIANVNAFDPPVAALPAPVDVEYARETAAERLARRQLNWTPCSSG